MPDTTPVLTAGIKGSQEFIENEILHSSYILFINSIAYLQDNIENFVKQSADKRKDIILEIVHADAYDKYYEKVREEITDRQNKTVISADKLEFLSKELENAKKESAGLIDAEKELKTRQKELAVEEKRLKTVQSTINDIKAQKSKGETLKMTNLKYQESIDMFRDHNKTAMKKMEKVIAIDLDSLKSTVDTIPTVEEKIKELETLEDKAAEWDKKYLELIRTAPVKQNYDDIIAKLNKELIKVIDEDIENCPELDNKPCPLLIKKQEERATDIGNRLQEYEKERDAYNIEMAAYSDIIEGMGKKPMTDRQAINSLRNKLHDLFQVKIKYENENDIIYLFLD